MFSAPSLHILWYIEDFHFSGSSFPQTVVENQYESIQTIDQEVPKGGKTPIKYVLPFSCLK